MNLFKKYKLIILLIISFFGWFGLTTNSYANISRYNPDCQQKAQEVFDKLGVTYDHAYVFAVTNMSTTDSDEDPLPEITDPFCIFTGEPTSVNYITMDNAVNWGLLVLNKIDTSEKIVKQSYSIVGLWDSKGEYDSTDVRFMAERDYTTVADEFGLGGGEQSRLRYEVPSKSAGSFYVYYIKTVTIAPITTVTPAVGESESGGETEMSKDFAEVFVCDNVLKNTNCETPEQVTVCKKKCSEAGGDCLYFEGKCKRRDSLTTDQKWDNYVESRYGRPEGYVGVIPNCGFTGECRDVNDIVQLIINFGVGIFPILGVFAFAFFIYGGFVMVTAFGSQERVSQGKKILGAAIMGLVIALSAYMVINFMLDALG
ncbi:MAG: pilin, partial [Candidatus Magasanikiibacteriota bacterium]